jgi:hypothetical protein
MVKELLKYNITFGYKDNYIFEGTIKLLLYFFLMNMWKHNQVYISWSLSKEMQSNHKLRALWHIKFKNIIHFNDQYEHILWIYVNDIE